MGSVQQMLVLAAIFMLSYLSITYYNSQNNNADVLLRNEYILTGASVGQSMLEEIQSKAFDENTISKSISSTDSLTSINQLGKDSGEVDNSDFDDVDDYHDYVKTFNVERLGQVMAHTSVNYIEVLDPETDSNVPTFNKKVEIVVSSNFFSEKLHYNCIIGY